MSTLQQVQQESYQLYFTQFPEGILRLNSKGQILDMNGQAERMLGWEKSNLCNTHIHDYLCPETADLSHLASNCLFSEEMLNHHIDTMDKEHPVEHFEQWWVKKNGVFINVDIKLFVVINSQGAVEIMLMFSDCSNQNFSAQEIKSLSLFPELNPSPVLQVSTESAITYANPAMTELMVEFGFSDSGLSNILPDDFNSIIQNCTDQQGKIFDVEKYNNNKCYSWNFHFVKEDKEPFIQIYGVDITARKNNEKHLKQLKELAEESNQQKTTFFASMSHELRTPLNGIIGMSNMLNDTHLNGIQKDYAETINKSADSLLMIINDVLDIAKIEAGKLEIDPTRFNLHQVIYDTVSVLDYQRSEKNQIFNVRIDPKIPKYLIGDGLRIRQIILNFLTNAVKFTPHGGYIFLNLSCDTEKLSFTTKNQILVHFSVADNGIGISTEGLNNIFGQFSQADKSTARTYGGTGLGLSISQELSHLMKGEVGVESRVNEGSTFWLELPLLIAEQEVIVEQDIELKNKLNSKRCILINSEAVSNNIIIELLVHWGIEVSVFEKIAAAEECIKDNKFDFALIANIQEEEKLQKLDKELKNYGIKSLNIINNVNHRQIKMLVNTGIDAYIFKPFLAHKFKQLLGLLINQNHANKTSDILSIHSIEATKQVSDNNIKLLKVLLVEDNLVNQKIAKAMIEKQGCHVDLANDGLEALEKWQENEYDIIFMDCNLPVLDGFECTRKIREQEQENSQGVHILIIALTANTEDETGSATKDAGMDGFLNKPISRQSLADIISGIN